MENARLVDDLKALVAIASVNGRDSEKACVDKIIELATSLGLKTQCYAKDPKRPNLLVTCGEGPIAVLFVAHVDTVGYTNDGWVSPPLVPTIREGNMYGRGTCDNKGGLVCALHAMSRLKDCSVALACVADEESGACSEIGLRHLLDIGVLDSAQAAIYAYPDYNITIGHRGLLRLVITVTGESVHTGSSRWASKTRGANASTALAEILLLIEQFKWPKDLHQDFPDLSLTVTPGTLINAGVFESIVPNKATGLVDIRLMPESDKSFIISSLMEA